MKTLPQFFTQLKIFLTSVYEKERKLSEHQRIQSIESFEALDVHRKEAVGFHMNWQMRTAKRELTLANSSLPAKGRAHFLVDWSLWTRAGYTTMAESVPFIGLDQAKWQRKHWNQTHWARRSCWWFSGQNGELSTGKLPQGIGLNSERFCAILDHVKVALQDASARGLLRRAPILQMDNAPCHRANATQFHIKDVLGWKQIVHPPYSPDLAPSDFHLFRSMKNHLRGVQFQNNTDLENWLTNFFESKNGTNFYQRGIQKLPEKWRTVINNNGHYIFT